MTNTTLSGLIVLSLCVAQPLSASSSRPFRMGVLSFDKPLDDSKPLALSDRAGWTANSDLLIGAFADGWLGAYSLTLKAPVWWHKLDEAVTAPMGSFGSSIVIGTRSGRITKLEAETGKAQWTANLDSFVERSFTLAGTTLYVLNAAQVLYALDFQSGTVKWLFDGGFPDGLTIRGSVRPILHSDRVICGLASGEVIAVDANTGKALWRYNPSYNDARFHDVVGEMVVANSRLLMSRYDGLVAAIDFATSDRVVVWQDKLPTLTTSAFRAGRYYVGSINGDIYAYNASTGQRVWRVSTGEAVSHIVVGEATLFIAGANGRVTALAAAGGEVLWHDDLAGALDATPVLMEGAIFFPTSARNIYGYKLN